MCVCVGGGGGGLYPKCHGVTSQNSSWALQDSSSLVPIVSLAGSCSETSSNIVWLMDLLVWSFKVIKMILF